MKIIDPMNLGAELGAQPGDTVEITCSPIRRPPNWAEPKDPPTPFDAVLRMSRLELHALGCRQWDDADGESRILMLFPAEWYNRIPVGFDLVCISGKREKFESGVTDDDRRFGLLAYGITVRDDRREN